MNLYLDTEFDGHGGPLISLAIAGDDGKTWESGDHSGGPFVTCECGATIEPTPVIVTTRKV